MLKRSPNVWHLVVALSLVINFPITAQVTIEAPYIEILDQKALTFFQPDTPVEILGEGYLWSEGPVWVPSLNALLFSDVPSNVIYQWQANKGVTEYLKPSGSTGYKQTPIGQGSNGLALNSRGELLLCQHGDRRIARLLTSIDSPMPEFQTLTDNFEGARFNSPNDLALGADGSIYFTDPPYGLPQGQHDLMNRDLVFNGVYRLTLEGEVQLIEDGLTWPNGIALSPDQKTLYVANSDSKRAIWQAWTIDSDGSVSNKRVLFDATRMIGQGPGKPDGLKVHPSGVLFATGPGGVLLITASGKHLATIHTITPSANVAFNDDFSALFITSANRLLRVQLAP